MCLLVLQTCLDASSPGRYLSLLRWVYSNDLVGIEETHGIQRLLDLELVSLTA